MHLVVVDDGGNTIRTCKDKGHTQTGRRTTNKLGVVTAPLQQRVGLLTVPTRLSPRAERLVMTWPTQHNQHTHQRASTRINARQLTKT